MVWENMIYAKKCLTSFVAYAIISVSRKVNHLISFDWVRLSVVRFANSHVNVAPLKDSIS